jgi:cysteine desulfurase family protein (TIGR01976 family)
MSGRQSLHQLLVREKSVTDFPIDAVRAKFPALERAKPFVYFDNAAGAQLPRNVLDAVAHHLLDINVQRGGRYEKSRDVDRMIATAREKVAVWLNASDPSEVCFGMNATSFIRLVSLAIAQTIAPERNQFVITDLDHDANVATWLALKRFGAEFAWWKMRDDGKLHVEDLLPLLSNKTKLVACTAVSHALGSLVDIAAVARAAHGVGADMFLDCVHYCPHALLDVQAWNCDYLVCSGYKAFAPHMGFLWGKRAKLLALPTFREEFIPDEPPYKIEAGTFIFENVSGMSAAVDYFEALGRDLSPPSAGQMPRDHIVTAMTAIRNYEQTLSRGLLDALAHSGATVYGVGERSRVDERVPTVCFNIPHKHPAEVVERMAEAGIGIRDGQMYAPRLMGRLGLAMDYGAVRVSLVHYNTPDEIQRFGDALKKIATGA